MRYSRDTSGLELLVAMLLLRRRVRTLKERNTDTAKRLGVTVEHLATLQDAMNNRGLMSCEPMGNRTRYWLTPAPAPTPAPTPAPPLTPAPTQRNQDGISTATA
jgi:hypothetical protein